MDVMAEAAKERSELADLLDTLGPEDWATPSLCVGWSVKDVVAHMISYEEHGFADVVSRLRRARWRPQRLNEAALEEYRSLEPAELVDFLRGHLEPRGLTAQRGGGVALLDGMIHHQDIRRPLGRPREIPGDRLLHALRFAMTAPPVRPFWHARGVRLVATDVGWTRGRGPEARGPGEAVLMTMTGRAGVAAELEGPGAAVLSARLG